MTASIILDFLILAFITWGGYQGYQKGLLEEVVGLLHFIIAFLISFKIIGLVLSLINHYIFAFHNTNYPEFIFALSIVGTNYLLAFMSNYLKTEIEYDFPGNWDNISGALAGVIKHLLVTSFVFWFMTGLGSFKPEVKARSYLYPVVEKVAFLVTGTKNEEDLDKMIKSFVE